MTTEVDINMQDLINAGLLTITKDKYNWELLSHR